MSSHLPRLTDQLRSIEQQGLRRRRRRVVPLPEGYCEIDGRKLRNFASNDYLNLAGDPRLIEAAAAALQTHGVGSRASALVSGRTDWHEELEGCLAEFEGQGGAILFPTGYAANLGTITALVYRDDAIFSDRLNHASLIDGCRLSKARLQIYHHDNLSALEDRLRDAGAFPRRWIITDTLFSMDGHAAPLRELCRLAERYDAALIVDEAHATGVFGERGRGLCEEQQVEEKVAVRVGTLSKAIGTLGGFVTGSDELIDWLWNRARPQIYSTALPPAVCAAACAAIEIIENEPERRKTLLQVADTLRRQLRAAGFNTPETAAGPIVPVILREPDLVMQTAARLEREGFLVGAIRPPTVPEGSSRLRISLTAAHTQEDVEEFIAVLSRAVETAEAAP